MLPRDNLLDFDVNSIFARFQDRPQSVHTLKVTSIQSNPISIQTRSSQTSPHLTSPTSNLPPNMSPLVATLIAVAVAATLAAASDTNKIFSPCSDTKVQKSDGFTFGIAFSSRPSFFLDQNITALQLSPCDRRLSSLGGGRLSVFRPKVDEISILTVNTTTDFSPDSNGGYMVAFAGRKYAARSLPAFIANSTYTVTSFTLVLEFQKGRLQNLFWKRDGCSRCAGQSNFVCLNKQDCAIRTSSCKRGGGGGDVDCSLGIQLAFSGTDKHYRSLNSWYEVEHLRQYSLYGLYSNLRSSLTDQYNRMF